VGDSLALCYHFLSERWDCTLSVTPERFEQQLAAFKRRGYRGVTFSELVEGTHADRAVAITFDDGYRATIELAEPLLRSYGMRGTLFVPTAFPGTDDLLLVAGSSVTPWLGTEFEAELVGMSWEEIGRLGEAGWEIGAHTRTHPRLIELDDAALEAELMAPLDDFERELGVRPRSVAYPYGDIDARVVAAARKAGYASGASYSRWLPRVADPLAFPRSGIYHTDSRARFALKMSPIVRRLRSRWGPEPPEAQG
jgi:peptidoglycan/xylan/chitin deacetylase (PgdA/CDA1 family)